MDFLRRVVLWVILRGPRLPFWLQVRAMDFILGVKGTEVPPAKVEPTVVTVRADDKDTEQWV